MSVSTIIRYFYIFAEKRRKSIKLVDVAMSINL